VKRDNRSEAEIAGLTKIKNASKQPKAARREAERINGDKRMGFLIFLDAEGIQAIRRWLSVATPPFGDEERRFRGITVSKEERVVELGALDITLLHECDDFGIPDKLACNPGAGC
jgi:hypothetical protein